MTITEILLPVLKGDPESLASLSSHAPQISSQLAGTPGLQFFAHGKILFDKGNPVPSDSGRTVLLLEWDTLSSLHEFYPHSPAFQGFIGLVKPFLAQGAIPIPFEAVESAQTAASAPITQIMQVRQRPETEGAWARLQGALANEPNPAMAIGQPVFTHAVGVEDQAGTFLGTVGWRSLKDYERARANETISNILGEFGVGTEALNVVVKLEEITAR
ncbi:hypothetical protein BJX66DRAFT_349684 [Aspergillus keveii]|uniref:ABM domain-containing protein n=1 Tax=Aspergillus keveii TaxID=714993 RepID=A0ABR4FJ02_9EURO